MTTTELSNPTIVGPERFSITEAQNNNFNIEIITCSRTLNRLRINPLVTLEKWKQMGKQSSEYNQGMKIDRITKENPNLIKVVIKNLGSQTKTPEVRLTNSISYGRENLRH